MTATIAQLGERALRRLGVAIVPVADRPALSVIIPAATIATNALLALSVIASDETPGDQDQAFALSKVTAIHDSLVSQAIVSWPLDMIPQAASEEYMQLTALHLATAFGKQGDPAQQPVLEARIRKIALIMRAPDLATQAVLAVHNDLASRGKVRWTVFDLPVAAETPYVLLATNLLAPQFGDKANPADDMTAMRALAQIIALPTSGERVVAEYF